MQMPGRKFNGGDYRYGYQGQEQDNEIKGEGNSVNYKYRMHDPRLGRFFAVDPLAPEYPHNSPYAFSENRVIDGVELEGLEWVYYTTVTLLHTGKTVVKTTHFYDKSVTGTIYNYKQKIEGSESE
ncbi:MAG: RHS repeat-associated core domain-containing protein, partial [Flavobacteriales bacterium]